MKEEEEQPRVRRAREDTGDGDGAEDAFGTPGEDLRRSGDVDPPIGTRVAPLPRGPDHQPRAEDAEDREMTA